MPQLRNNRAQPRNVIVGAALSGLIALLGHGGCAVSDPSTFILLPDAGVNGAGGAATGGSSDPSTGGSFGSGGTSASGGSFGSGGDLGKGGSTGFGGFNGAGGVRSTGGTTGTGGLSNTGGFTGSGGFTGAGGTVGTGGTPATGGTTGSGGTRATGGTTGSGGTTGAGGAGGSAPTFTQIYQTILTVSCSGSACHNPGSQKGVSFASQSSAYSAVKSRVTVGNGTGSSFYKLVNGGGMPPGGKLSSSQLSEIAAWINAGALNN